MLPRASIKIYALTQTPPKSNENICLQKPLNYKFQRLLLLDNGREILYTGMHLMIIYSVCEQLSTNVSSRICYSKPYPLGKAAICAKRLKNSVNFFSALQSIKKVV